MRVTRSSPIAARNPATSSRSNSRAYSPGQSLDPWPRRSSAYTRRPGARRGAMENQSTPSSPRPWSSRTGGSPAAPHTRYVSSTPSTSTLSSVCIAPRIRPERVVSPPSHGSLMAVPVGFPEPPLVELAVGVAGHLRDEVDGLGALVAREPPRAVVEDGGRQLRAGGVARGGFHDRLDLLAPVVVRNAEGGGVGDGGVGEQRGLDFGRVDVDPARDDHVDLAVAEVEIAVVVEEAGVTDGEVVADPVLGGLALVLVVAEAAGAHLHVDGAEFTGRQFPPVIVEDGDFADGPGLADRSRLRQPVLGGGEGSAALAPRVGLLDAAAPPVDHGAFHVVRAGRGAVDGVAHRGDVVGPP